MAVVDGGLAYVKDLRPRLPRPRYERALGVLQASGRTVIGHVDCGVYDHPALGYRNGRPPHWLRLDLGRDFLSNDPKAPPVTDLRIGPTFIDRQTDWPDHGLKTLSCILSDTPQFRGVAPEVQVVPVRIADGPVFQDQRQRDNMGLAMEHLLALPVVPRVISISMGNPGFVGLLQFPFNLVGQKPGFDKRTRRAFDRAYEMGVIVVCAAGQVIDRVIYPARYASTIAVGGYRSDRVTHYPPDDYDIPERVDIWALADGMNRAFAYRRPDGTVHSGYAEDLGSNTQDISGTSYATPQVAAAAALWAETHFHALPRIGAPDGWKAVEAFRAALRGSAEMRGLRLGGPGRRIVVRPCLDIERLLGAPPVLPGEEARKSRATFWGRQM